MTAQDRLAQLVAIGRDRALRDDETTEICRLLAREGRRRRHLPSAVTAARGRLSRARARLQSARTLVAQAERRLAALEAELDPAFRARIARITAEIGA